MHRIKKLKRAINLARDALKIMDEHDIPPTPANFLVWYEYCRGGQQQLKKALDLLISDKSPFTLERNEEIHARFFVATDEGVEIADAGAALQRQINSVIRSIEQAKTDTGDYGRKLIGYSSDLGDLASEPIYTLVGEMRRDTEAMAERSRALEEELAAATLEIEELRKNLSQVRQEAMTDALTGLANRQGFDRRLREMAARAMEDDGDLSLFLLDIDHFKVFNDTYGHSVGDSVLRVVGRTLMDGVKGQDLPARYGGEEFAVILPNTPLPAALIVAEQLRERVARAELKETRSGKSFGGITLSAGVATYRLGEALSNLVDRADAGLYRAKETGRNRVVGENDLPEASLEATG